MRAARSPAGSSRWRDAAALAVVVGLAWAGNAAWQRAAGDRATDRLVALARPGDIRMLSSLTCAYCEAARRWLTQRQVPFDECFIERDAACATRYRALLSPGTPTLLVRGQRQVGFSPAAVAEALDRPR